jgi:hypothetical protein
MPPKLLAKLSLNVCPLRVATVQTASDFLHFGDIVAKRLFSTPTGRRALPKAADKAIASPRFATFLLFTMMAKE